MHLSKNQAVGMRLKLRRISEYVLTKRTISQLFYKAKLLSKETVCFKNMIKLVCIYRL